VADLTPPIPVTKMALRYARTKGLHDQERRNEAKQLAADPEPLARDFADSVQRFAAEYDQQDQPFFPTPRDPPEPKDRETIARTEDIAWLLHRQGTLPVADHPELDADYVEYEVVATRTPGGAKFEQLPGDLTAKTARSALRLDLLLANHIDRTPIVAEVKRRRDADPYVALIQTLTALAHLATPSQYRRLGNHFDGAGFPPQGAPRLDGYVVLYAFGKDKSTFLEELGEYAQDIGAGLVDRPEVAPHLRRLVCLDLELDGNGTLRAGCRWPGAK
jgi:hypothetical protein